MVVNCGINKVKTRFHVYNVKFYFRITAQIGSHVKENTAAMLPGKCLCLIVNDFPVILFSFFSTRQS